MSTLTHSGLAAALVSAPLVVGAMLVGCGLNFDQFNAVGADASSGGKGEGGTGSTSSGGTSSSGGEDSGASGGPDSSSSGGARPAVARTAAVPTPRPLARRAPRALHRRRTARNHRRAVRAVSCRRQLCERARPHVRHDDPQVRGLHDGQSVQRHHALLQHDDEHVRPVRPGLELRSRHDLRHHAEPVRDHLHQQRPMCTRRRRGLHALLQHDEHALRPVPEQHQLPPLSPYLHRQQRLHVSDPRRRRRDRPLQRLRRRTAPSTVTPRPMPSSPPDSGGSSRRHGARDGAAGRPLRLADAAVAAGARDEYPVTSMWNMALRSLTHASASVALMKLPSQKMQLCAMHPPVHFSLSEAVQLALPIAWQLMSQLRFACPLQLPWQLEIALALAVGRGRRPGALGVAARRAARVALPGTRRLIGRRRARARAVALARGIAVGLAVEVPGLTEHLPEQPPWQLAWQVGSVAVHPPGSWPRAGRRTRPASSASRRRCHTSR